MGVLRLLDIIKQIKPDIKFYQASTSEMFGKVRETPQNESTPFYPRSPYAVSKVFSHYITQNYRESYDMFACSGILFNHESELRGMEFVTRKITSTLVDIKYGLAERLLLGNLDSKRDWGYAPEYVEGMYLMLQQEKPDDYVLATGNTHTVREFIERSSQILGFDLVWEGEGIDSKGIDRKSGKTILEVSREFYRPAEVDLLVGDSSKARDILGWYPKTNFDKLVEIMIESDLKRAQKS
jgi:GDPmannose 4,6-dehydratase